MAAQMVEAAAAGRRGDSTVFHLFLHFLLFGFLLPDASSFMQRRDPTTRSFHQESEYEKGTEPVVRGGGVSPFPITIEDDLESEDGISDNEQVESHSGYKASTKHEMKNSNVMDEPDDVTGSKKEINETKEEEIPQKHNHFYCNSTPSNDSCPPGFKFLKGQSSLKPHGSESHKTSHYSTSLAKYHEKDFKGTSLLHEINHVIEVGDPPAKATLWNSLLSFAQHHQGRYVLFGDLDEIRDKHERFGTNFSRSEAQVFNKFVVDSGLLEMISGKSFTWMNKLGTKMNILWSDHSPILLHTLKTNYGSIPFKFFHSWFHQKDIDVVVKQAFVDTPQATDIDHKIDSSMASDFEKETRLQLLHEIHNIDRMESMDLFQKAHIKWDIEGDENIKFFHSLIKQNRRRQAIQGIMVDGPWVSNLVQVKEAFLDFYKEKFQSHVPQVSCSNHSSFRDFLRLKETSWKDEYLVTKSKKQCGIVGAIKLRVQMALHSNS
nr:RNA-directed DNA polymerase, eukaryota, reverse transcriptase zinc-binding domain protein [Tanacetum cinerariifolium]